MQTINPAEVRYIKLGAGGAWATHCLAEGEMHFGYPTVPHELCREGKWDDVVERLMTQGRSLSKARDGLREIRDFYTLGPDCLWITMADGHLWWAFAHPDVTWLGDGDDAHGTRMRRTRGGWHNTDITGAPLRLDALSTKLTQVAAYRQTICKVAAADYCVRRINAIEEPVVARAREARNAMVAAAADMVAGLHWADFEVMVDLIFARSGWQRISAVGGTQKDIDLILEQPTTGERAFVQVKSKATQAVLDDYIERYQRSRAYQRLFFVCHSPKGRFAADKVAGLHVWVGDALAEAAVRSGLFDWLIERTG